MLGILGHSLHLGYYWHGSPMAAALSLVWAGFALLRGPPGIFVLSVWACGGQC